MNQSEHVMAWTVLMIQSIKAFTPPCSHLPTIKHLAKYSEDNRGGHEAGVHALKKHHSQGVKAFHPWTNNLLGRKSD